ncbi:hypothetical protein STCU_09540 [Strigomonas culicis]|uniref:Uncharacterized protein n=1 Tax=Strigomonas culicis TaxID=28005 RepID=S9TS01_9TRYP|nr:hypothetical protein STCU_09540 [Strigomonas culicis]|eukprot:EPY19288.1 hypothetical protein STCU_09540 [Strigomonas culicis]
MRCLLVVGGASAVSAAASGAAAVATLTMTGVMRRSSKLYTEAGLLTACASLGPPTVRLFPVTGDTNTPCRATCRRRASSPLSVRFHTPLHLREEVRAGRPRDGEGRLRGQVGFDELRHTRPRAHPRRLRAAGGERGQRAVAARPAAAHRPRRGGRDRGGQGVAHVELHTERVGARAAAAAQHTRRGARPVLLPPQALHGELVALVGLVVEQPQDGGQGGHAALRLVQLARVEERLLEGRAALHVAGDDVAHRRVHRLREVCLRPLDLLPPRLPRQRVRVVHRLENGAQKRAVEPQRRLLRVVTKIDVEQIVAQLHLLAEGVRVLLVAVRVPARARVDLRRAMQQRGHVHVVPHHNEKQEDQVHRAAVDHVRRRQGLRRRDGRARGIAPGRPTQWLRGGRRGRRLDGRLLLLVVVAAVAQRHAGVAKDDRALHLLAAHHIVLLCCRLRRRGLRGRGGRVHGLRHGRRLMRLQCGRRRRALDVLRPLGRLHRLLVVVLVALEDVNANANVGEHLRERHDAELREGVVKRGRDGAEMRGGAAQRTAQHIRIFGDEEEGREHRILVDQRRRQQKAVHVENFVICLACDTTATHEDLRDGAPWGSVTARLLVRLAEKVVELVAHRLHLDIEVAHVQVGLLVVARGTGALALRVERKDDGPPHDEVPLLKERLHFGYPQRLVRVGGIDEHVVKRHRLGGGVCVAGDAAQRTRRGPTHKLGDVRNTHVNGKECTINNQRHTVDVTNCMTTSIGRRNTIRRVVRYT